MPAIDALAFIAAAGQPVATAQIVALVIAFLGLLLSGFISGSEISFFSLSEQQVEDLYEDERGSGRTVARLLARSDRLLATILICNNLVNVTIVVLTNFALGPVFANMDAWLSFVLQSVILTFLILLFGEIMPKLIATNYPLKWAIAAAPGVDFLSKLCWPLSRLLVSSTAIVNKVVTKQASISADELSQALDITDVKAKDDKDMLQGILKFGETVASEVMTPRVSIVGIDEDSTFAEVMDIILAKGYSRLPVYAETMDNIRGILYSRDLLPYIGKEGDGFDWRTLLRDPYYVPESRQIDKLLEDFRKLKQHIAIVIDEFGGTQGVVTLEDVLEEIVGDINDEYDDEDDKLFTRLAPDTYNFDGRTPLTDFFRVTGLDEGEFEEVSEDSETLAGMLLAIKGDFPKDKEPLVYGRCRFLVLKVADHRIMQVRVKVMSSEQS